jgi:plasmid stability protein
MEEEARDILRQVVGQPSAPRNLGQAIHARFAAAGGVDLPPANRSAVRPAPDFE